MNQIFTICCDLYFSNGTDAVRHAFHGVSIDCEIGGADMESNSGPLAVHGINPWDFSVGNSRRIGLKGMLANWSIL